jgi:hypothetical protein
MKPTVGQLVRISDEYPNTEAAGTVALVTATLGVECQVQPCPFGRGSPISWWFERRWLEVLS